MTQRRRKKAPSSSDEFIHCDFILGSVAEVERLWSLAKYVLTDDRRQMTFQLFEALVFLEMNHRFWDARLVSEAIGCARSERAKARMDANELFLELGGEDMA